MSDSNFEKVIESLSSLVKQRRKELGLTQGDVGEKIGRPQSTVARFESGIVKDPHISLIFHICDVLGERPGDLMNEAFDKAGGGKLSKKQIDKKLKDLREKLDGLDDDRKELVTSLIDGLKRLM
jgi:transcriptional regulator with XRE-family HTH domain